MKITKFEDFKIWRDALSITKIIYDITSRPKFIKDFALRDQVRKAVLSISANIVEGFEKNNNNEFIRYLKISKGSIGELRNFMYIAFAIGYFEKDLFDQINQKLISLANQIGSFISYLEKVRKSGNFIKTTKPVNSLTR